MWRIDGATTENDLTFDLYPACLTTVHICQPHCTVTVKQHLVRECASDYSQIRTV